MFSDYHALFSWFNMLALLGWALLMFSPKRWKGLLFITGIGIPCFYGLIYAGLMFTHMSSVDGGGYASFAQVQALMSSQPVLLAGWLHYLSFDLFVGTYIAREADKIGIVRLVQLPLLFCTFYFGPVGLVLFLLTKAAWQAFMQNKTEPLQQQDTV